MSTNPNFMRRVANIPILLSSEGRQERIFWKMLKNHFKKTGYSFGTFEKEKTIQMEFELSDESDLLFSYFVYKNSFCLRCNFLSYADPLDASEIFILAQHLNNLIREGGKIRIDTEDQTLSLFYQVDYRQLLFGYADLEEWIDRHSSLVYDVRKSFLRLLTEGIEPAIIIADLLNRDREDDASNENPDTNN